MKLGLKAVGEYRLRHFRTAITDKECRGQKKKSDV